MKSNYNLMFLLGIAMLSTVSLSFGQVNEPTVDSCSHESPETEQIAVDGIDFFASDELLQMTLCFDIKEFTRTRNKPEYFEATLTVKSDEGDSVSQVIKLKARGEMRRAYCNFPPVMLKFYDRENEPEKIQSKGTIKLVTHCMPTTLYQNYVLKEYLTYRLFNHVTPYSLKTRLVKVKYVDINKPEKAFTAFGFLIENEDKMAERNQAIMIKSDKLTQKNMFPNDMARIAMFNFMIGNTDWSVPLQHNIKIMRSLTVFSDKAIPVIYDFDYSGLVNTIYAIPFEELPIKEVTERYYMGLCYKEEELKPILDEFVGLKEKILSTVSDFEYLPKGDKKAVETYLNGFYKTYTTQNALLHDMNCSCKQF